jgi:UDP-N-acetylmuramoyl-L-alanyl-D-glutamate--2,6-diaminopimelate ligase
VVSPLTGVFNVSASWLQPGRPHVRFDVYSAVASPPGGCIRSIRTRGCGQPFGCGRYAHTDDALGNVIKQLGLASGRVVTLFGCSGDRDRTKRPLMGMAAAELSVS